MTDPLVQGYVKTADGRKFRIGGPRGIQGPPGEPGPPGPPGELPATDTAAPGDVLSYDGSGYVWNGLGYRHVQGVPAAVWTIDHDLSFVPSVTIIDSAGQQVHGSVEYGPNRVVVTFSAAFSGEAVLS